MSAPAFVDLAVDPERVRELLVAAGLIAATAPTPPIEALTGGVSSNILRVELPSGPVCVKQALPKLKVAKDWEAPTSRVFAEIDWLGTAQRIVPGCVPRVLGADRERGAFVMEYFGGRANWKAELLAGRIDVGVAERVATAVVSVHRATAGDPAVARSFRYDGTFFAIRLEPYLVEAARVHPDLATELIGLVHVTQTTPRALVHGDISPKNILLDGTMPVLLDAECAWYGDPAFDLAFLLNHMLLKAAHLPAHATRIGDLYQAICRVYLAGIDWEPAATFERRCARLLPGLLLARIDGKSPVEYLDDATRVTVRQRARALLAQPRDRLADVLAACG